MTGCIWTELPVGARDLSLRHILARQLASPQATQSQRKKSFLNPFFAGSICCSKLCQLNRAVPAGRYPARPLYLFYAFFWRLISFWFFQRFSNVFPLHCYIAITFTCNMAINTHPSASFRPPPSLSFSLSFPTPLYCLLICALISIAAIFDYLILCAPHCCMHRLANTLELQPS